MLGFDYCEYVEAIGLVGGLLFLWNKEIELSVKRGNAIIINCVVRDKFSSNRWCISFVMAFFILEIRKDFGRH